mgnify:CR=1 FL=1
MKGKHMNNHLIFSMVATVLLFVSTGYAASSTEYEPAGDGAAPCGIENCHGLDITCGENIAEICTMEYRLGDFCREYASCAVVDGQCRLVEDPLFAKCRTCVQQCSLDHRDDPIAAFNCELRCREALPSKTDATSSQEENENVEPGSNP